MKVPLVLLPGMMCDRRLFSPQIDHLAPVADIWVGDIGRHRSIAGIASALLSEAPFDRFAVCGLSMGGIVAMEMIRQAPERVERAAFLNTTPLADAPGRAAIRDRQVAEVRAGKLRSLFLAEMLPHYLAGQNASDRALGDLLTAMALDLGEAVFENQSVALRDRLANEAALAAFAGATLVLCGDEDRMCPVDRHERIAALCRNSDLHVLSGVGHISSLEAPEAVSRALTDWLTGNIQGKEI